MRRRNFLAAMGGTAAAQTISAPLHRQPNIILILADDLGYADIGPYGLREARTPALDRLARQGVRFTQSYSNGQMCTPTRCALMTGRYQQRYGLEWATSSSHHDIGIRASVPTLPRLLKNAGYRTAMYGKWHLGRIQEMSPNAHGFDDFFGITSGYCDFYSHRTQFGDLDLWHNGKATDEPGYLTDLLTRRAVNYVDAHAKANHREPFFLYVAHTSPHWPFQPPNKPTDIRNTDTWYDGTRADYLKMVESMDASIGTLLSAVERNGLADNTLVIFTNDNGGERLSDNTPFFHHKTSLFEGGIRVPTIMRWPRVFPAGRDCVQPMISMDLTRTMLVAGGTPGPANLEGIDLAPYIRGEQPICERTFHWRVPRPSHNQRAVRRGNLKWLLDRETEFLFDVAKDPGERTNLFARMPDQAAALRREYDRWEAELKREPPPFVFQ
jgi:arylsulfatase A